MINQCVAVLTGVTEKNTDLTVGRFTKLSTLLSFDTYGFVPLFGKAAAINNGYTIFITKVLIHFLPMLGKDRFILPASLAQKVLHITDGFGIISIHVKGCIPIV